MILSLASTFQSVLIKNCFKIKVYSLYEAKENIKSWTLAQNERMSFLFYLLVINCGDAFDKAIGVLISDIQDEEPFSSEFVFRYLIDHWGKPSKKTRGWNIRMFFCCFSTLLLCPIAVGILYIEPWGYLSQKWMQWNLSYEPT